VRGNEKNRYVRLNCEQVCNYLVTRNVRQKEIDNAKSKAPVTRLFDSILPCCYKHDLVAVRLKHKPERVAYGRLVIDNENRGFFFALDVGHSCYSTA